MVIADAGPAMTKLAHHDRIPLEDSQQCQVFVLALSAKDKKNVSAFANSPSNESVHRYIRSPLLSIVNIYFGSGKTSVTAMCIQALKSS